MFLYHGVFIFPCTVEFGKGEPAAAQKVFSPDYREYMAGGFLGACSSCLN